MDNERRIKIIRFIERVISGREHYVNRQCTREELLRDMELITGLKLPAV